MHTKKEKLKFCRDIARKHHLTFKNHSKFYINGKTAYGFFHRSTGESFITHCTIDKAVEIASSLSEAV